MGMWPLKIQHDTLQQAFANMTCLACPIMLSCISITNNENEETLREINFICTIIERIGFGMFLLSALWENIADVQMELYIRSKGNNRFYKNNDSGVLGYSENMNDTKKKNWSFCLWTYCRHPNYFGEWMVWNSFIVMSLPKLWKLHITQQEHPIVIICFLISFYIMSRFFYDCLLYWTGAEPAEYFSYQKRTQYGKYQEQTRVFFPFELPAWDHGRYAGWPYHDA